MPLLNGVGPSDMIDIGKNITQSRFVVFLFENTRTSFSVYSAVELAARGNRLRKAAAYIKERLPMGWNQIPF